MVRPLADRFTAVPAKTEDAVRLNGAVQMVAGTLLALGRFPRLSALALAATLVPTTRPGTGSGRPRRTPTGRSSGSTS